MKFKIGQVSVSKPVFSSSDGTDITYGPDLNQGNNPSLPSGGPSGNLPNIPNDPDSVVLKQEYAIPAAASVDANPGFPLPGKKISIESDIFNTATVLTSPNSFDVDTGIISDKPEIIALTDFVPTHTEDGAKLTKFGELLQAKQDAVLVSARESIKSILALPQADKILNKIERNKEIIRNFCSSFGKDISNLLFEFETIKKKMDFRYPHDIKTLELLGMGPEDGYQPGSPTTVEDFLGVSADVTNIWSPTKTWIQSCLFLKPILREGMKFSAGQPLNVNSPFSSPYSSPLQNPYSIVFDDDKTTRFSYSNRYAGKVPNIFGENSEFVERLLDQFYDFDETNDGSPEVTNDIVSQFSKIFENIDDLTIFNKKFFTGDDTIEESISKLSYLICKEFLFSNQIQKIFPLADYGFEINTADNNKNIWDYLIGQAGNDITIK